MKVLNHTVLQLSLMSLCALISCRTAQPIVTRQELIGNYIYVSEDPEGKTTDHEYDRLTLQANGRYERMQGGSTKAKSEVIGHWHFHDGDPAEVDLDHAGYPVQLRGTEIRLMIDTDVGIWYAKHN